MFRGSILYDQFATSLYTITLLDFNDGTLYPRHKSMKLGLTNDD